MRGFSAAAILLRASPTLAEGPGFPSKRKSLPGQFGRPKFLYRPLFGFTDRPSALSASRPPTLGTYLEMLVTRLWPLARNRGICMAEIPKRWLILTTRYGKDIQNPSQEDLRHALEELRKEDPQTMTKVDYAAHANAWLRCGTDAGPIYLLSTNRDGTTSLSEFANQDADDPVGELTKKVSFENALALWNLLATGNPDEVEAELANDNPTCPD
jgi:hypothetical protein